MEERVFWLWVRLPRWSPTGLERGDGWRGVVLLGNESGSLSSAHIKTWLDSRSVLHIAKCSFQKAEYRTQSALLWLLLASLYTILMNSLLLVDHVRRTPESVSSFWFPCLSSHYLYRFAISERCELLRMVLSSVFKSWLAGPVRI